MTIEEAIRGFLQVGLATARVYSHRAPQTLPDPVEDAYIVFYRVSSAPQHTHNGPQPAIEREYQFSVFHKSQSTAIQLSDRLIRLLDGYRGAMGDVVIHSCYWAFDNYTFNDLTTPQLHQINSDFRITYTPNE
jgi:hypothetical protein